MIAPDLRAAIRRLVLVEGWKIESVARHFGVHHGTVRRALRDEVPDKRTQEPSVLEPFKPYIVARLEALPQLSAVRLLSELRPRGYAYSLSLLRRYVAQVRAPRSRKAYLRMEPDPAQQAQVDWGSFGAMRVGTAVRPLSVFSMVLSFSRALFIDFCFDQRMETFLRMHRRALEYFGGVPRRILYDNLKSVVLHHVGSVVQFNPRALAFGGHYLFEPTAAPVRYPEAKGRVEASIKFIRQSFFYGRSFASLDDLRRQARAWLDEVANQRIHATTRKRPADLLLVERPRLRALPPRPFDTDLVLVLIVSKEARVRFDTNSYSVPPHAVGKTVHLRADDHTVRVILDGQVIAHHGRCWDRRRHIEDPAHVEALLARRAGARAEKRGERLLALCPEMRPYLHEIARRKVRLDHEHEKLLRLVDRYGDTEVAGAVAKAVAARTFGARFVRALCDQARFARGLGEPPEPVTTGNPAADDLVVHPHDMESYDALFDRPRKAAPHSQLAPAAPAPAPADVLDPDGDHPDDDDDRGHR